MLDVKEDDEEEAEDGTGVDRTDVFVGVDGDDDDASNKAKENGYPTEGMIDFDFSSFRNDLLFFYENK